MNARAPGSRSQALQRVVVRMLYDPQFVLAIYEDAATVLADVALDERAFAWLTAPDIRSWTADRERRGRTLAALIEEYPVTTWLHGARDGFMSSSLFHSCVQLGGALAVAYGDYLSAEIAQDPRGWPLPLEHAMARLRRPMEGSTWVAEGYMLAPRWACVGTREGAMEAYAALQAHIAASGVTVGSENEAPSDGARWGPAPNSDEAFVLLERTLDDRMEMSGASEALGRLLQAAGDGAEAGRLLRIAGDFGCDAREAQELLDELVVDGLLMPLVAV